MLKKLQIKFKIFFIYFFLVSTSYADLLKPRSDINPAEVVSIQLEGLKMNDQNLACFIVLNYVVHPVKHKYEACKKKRMSVLSVSKKSR